MKPQVPSKSVIKRIAAITGKEDLDHAYIEAFGYTSSYAKIRDFLEESLRIEGIKRAPNPFEMDATEEFLNRKKITVKNVSDLALTYDPKAKLRNKEGMNIIVGKHRPPSGSPVLAKNLEAILDMISKNAFTPYECHKLFETLHPFMDGNGRTGRTLWAWHMIQIGKDPFSLPFLHRWYYQSLEDGV